jgi:hypothetical protein
LVDLPRIASGTDSARLRTTAPVRKIKVLE